MVAQQFSETIIVGAGQAGLSVARALKDRQQKFRILERADSVGMSWAQRWDSLRLFTPAQYCALDGLPFPALKGSFPTKDQVAEQLRVYARELAVETGVQVYAVKQLRSAGADLERFAVDSSLGAMTATNVVIATGATSTPHIPKLASALNPAIHQLHSSAYRNPGALPAGPVLVVGAGTSGMEIAIELARQRQVWLAGRIPFHVPDLALKHAGALYWQFIHRILTRRTPLGRKIARDFTAQGGPLISVSLADARKAGVISLPRLEAVSPHGLPMFPEATKLDGTKSVAMGLEASVVLWATGFEPEYGWIDGVPVDGRGWPVTTRGEVGELPGLFFVGLPFQYGLTSTLLGGVGRDAEHVAMQIARAN